MSTQPNSKYSPAYAYYNHSNLIVISNKLSKKKQNNKVHYTLVYQNIFQQTKQDNLLQIIILLKNKQTNKHNLRPSSSDGVGKVIISSEYNSFLSDGRFQVQEKKLSFSMLVRNFVLSQSKCTRTSSKWLF